MYLIDSIFFPVFSCFTCLVSSSGELWDSDTAHVACGVDSSLLKNGLEVYDICSNMDAGGLRSYLNEHVKEPEALHERVVGALRCAPDPVKLAFDVFRAFHQEYPGKDQAHANETCCVFVLDKLMTLSPPVTRGES